MDCLTSCFECQSPLQRLKESLESLVQISLFLLLFLHCLLKADPLDLRGQKLLELKLSSFHFRHALCLGVSVSTVPHQESSLCPPYKDVSIA